MYIVREVFNTKPGKAKDLVKMFKKAMPLMENQDGMKSYRIMTDIVSDYWTVVMEAEVDDIGAFLGGLRGVTASDELKDIMKGYMDLVNAGHREVFIVE
jgi:Antibiotic biosynthesis monooxygenase